jgi:hypothetical protein
LKAIIVLLLSLAVACAHRDVPRADSPAASVVAVAPSAKRPPSAAADALLMKYLALVVERDGVTPPKEFAGIHSDAEPCAQESYGDGVSAYWLARGRVLGYTPEADTLRARLELLTVAAQEPRSDTEYGSVVTARVRTDTLLLKLVPDSARLGWQTCGLLSDGHDLGGYGLPQNTRYDPPSFTRAKLLLQIDSIRKAPSSK